MAKSGFWYFCLVHLFFLSSACSAFSCGLVFKLRYTFKLILMVCKYMFSIYLFCKKFHVKWHTEYFISYNISTTNGESPTCLWNRKENECVFHMQYKNFIAFMQSILFFPKKFNIKIFLILDLIIYFL